MKIRIGQWMVLAGLLATTAFGADKQPDANSAGASAEQLAKPTLKSGETLLSGTFTWAQKPNEIHNIYVVLTPSGSNSEWNAVYLFKWSKKDTTFTGTVKGNLQNGTLSGDATPSDKKRVFHFDGTAKSGVINYTSSETTGNKHANQGSGSFKLETSGAAT